MLWGTLLLGAVVVQVLEGGLRSALLALVPAGDSAAWAWGNLLAIAAALVAWPTAAAVLLRLRRAR